MGVVIGIEQRRSDLPLINAHIHTHTHARIHTRTHAHTHAHTHTRTRARTCIVVLSGSVDDASLRTDSCSSRRSTGRNVRQIGSRSAGTSLCSLLGTDVHPATCRPLLYTRTCSMTGLFRIQICSVYQNDSNLRAVLSSVMPSTVLHGCQRV